MIQIKKFLLPSIIAILLLSFIVLGVLYKKEYDKYNNSVVESITISKNLSTERDKYLTLYEKEKKQVDALRKELNK